MANEGMSTGAAITIGFVLGAAVTGVAAAVMWPRQVSSLVRRGELEENPASAMKRFCPTGSVVQTLLFPKDKFTVTSAKAWARKHGKKSGKVDVTEKYIRLRQLSPGGFARMRNIPLGSSGVRAVVGWRTC